VSVSNKHVDLEEASVALRTKTITKPADEVACLPPKVLIEDFWNISLPHQPPRYGVSCRCPVNSDMNGPTTVPLRVRTASTATGRLLIRFITLTSLPMMSGDAASSRSHHR
jgi:hypothetical protein